MLKDIYTFIRYIIPQAWPQHRQFQKNMREVLALEKKHGVYKAFLLYFEEAIPILEEDELAHLLNCFISEENYDGTDKHCITILEYTKLYAGVSEWTKEQDLNSCA